ncbi:S-layer homology domain-containing protein [Anaerotignum sp.]|uniref:S-layer homology domain-containing protein n=1 Tax=Anaerotignum sp. TaxID=2039241 RepID=UPI002A91F583|nr:S-layer homology domain-containing protein [Anaerotignum sp.]MCI7658439.1 S-layer homology domain-containing protein [Clostridia bacterium]MDY5414229.1 S-layer homology domain-containing protein [Anaerotignum sp.]
MKRKVLPCFMALSMTLTAVPNVAMAEDGSMNEAETVVETTVETEPTKESAGEVGASEVVDAAEEKPANEVTEEKDVVEATEIQPAMEVATEEVVAENGVVKVATVDELTDAVAKAADSGVETTIQLTDNIKDLKTGDIIVIPVDAKIILDMNGKTISTTNDFVGRPIKNNGYLTITGNGTIDSSLSDSDGYGAIDNYGELVIENGTFTGSVNAGGASIKNRPKAELTIRDGLFNGAPTAVYNSGKADIYGGTFDCHSCSSCNKNSWGYTIQSHYNSGGDMPELNFYDGKVIGVQGAFSTSAGKTEIYDGTFETVACDKHLNGSSAFYALYVAGESGKVLCNVHGGTFKSISKVAAFIGNSNDGGDKLDAVANFYGGTFITGDNNNVIHVDEKLGGLEISGGQYLMKDGSTKGDVSQWLASGMLQGEDGTVIVNPNNAAQVGDKYYELLSDAIAQAEPEQTIVLLKNVTEDITVNKNIIIDGQDQFTISGNTKLQNGTLQNLTLTNEAGKEILTIGSTDKNTIKMDGVTVEYPVNDPKTTVTHVLNGNNADITITGCTFMNEANNNGVTEGAPEWSYGLYMNDQGTGSFTFTKSRFDGAFRTMLPNINGTVSITDNVFVNSIFSNNSGSTSGSGEEATCITTANTDGNVFNITGNTFDNAGAFYFQKTAGATVTGNTFKSDKFEHYVQVRGGAANPLDLTENTFEMGKNALVIMDVAAAPVKLPAGQKAVNYWAWVDTDASVRPADYSSYVYAYNEDGSRTFYPGEQAAMDAFLNPAPGNIGMTKDDTLYVKGKLELKHNITEGRLVVSGNGQLNVSDGVEIADDALAMEPGAEVTGLKTDISDSIDVPDGYKLVVTKDQNGEYTYALQKKSSGGSHRYDGYITVINPKNGTVSVSDDWADEDQKITLTITPDKGYVVDKIEIVDAEGDKIEAKKVEDKDNKYTFRMANCDVTVTVTFKEEGKTTTEDKEETGETEETTKPETITFIDVKESDWFYKGVSYVVENGMMNGVGNDQFAPNAPLTREMLAVVLYNMEKQPESTGVNPFADVKADMWYTDAIVWANANGIVAGYDDSTFGLGDSITREQLATILYRYAQMKGYDVTKKADLAGYTDSASISGYAVEAMQWANANGIVNGMTATTLAPQGTATRAQVATILMNFCENVATKAE